ncbi:MAG: hypothetical protein H0T75_12745 [Rhizobiales bacterium]|nr:hypothetical protein [Hyphomicrobiales bacterium]
MPIVDLIIAVCMAGDPIICRDEHLYFESHGSLQRCMFEAMPAVADWAGKHPQWRVSRFHCEWVAGDEERT